ncbi:hypothetical protein CRM22_001443 [Opisthorchis felineus]|uniref:Uncharacterized protein n=1 Tax=Opisthorchis felineus TaxID=147828 RepID=A0A4S2MAT2_OPIFE|nr:hypothetical protein CRM22_001443 [Opisthorchis felineus]
MGPTQLKPRISRERQSMKFVCLRQIFFIIDCKVVRDYEDRLTGMDEQIKREKKSVTSDDKIETKGVAFSGGELTEKGKRKRYLTAKYDKKTRIVVNKKIQLENFISQQLRSLYKTEHDDYDCDIDLETLDELPSIESKRKFLQNELKTCTAPEPQVLAVVGERFIGAA